MVRTAARYLRGGQIVSLKGADPDLTLLDHLRLEQGVTGVKEGCNEGDCGACTVILARMRDGRLVHEAVNSCVLLAGQADGAEVITVEDLAPGGVLHPVQQALVRHHGSQCGFCTPGIVMSLFALYHEGARPPTRAAVTDQLAGNLCRCTGYRPIIEAALEVCGGAAQDRFGSEVAERSAALEHLADGADLFSGDEDRFFAAPAGVDSLARLYERHPDAVLIGGATDVGLWITKKLKELPKVIWLGRVNGLAGIEDRGGTLRIGAGTTLAQAAPALAGIDPDLGEVMRRFGSAQVRASGTVGGNIANGSPIGDLAPCLIALGATLVLQKGADARSMPLDSFFLGYGRQDREAGEFVRALEVPKLAAGQKFRAFKLSKRFDEDISTVLGAFRFDCLGRQVRGARIAFGGMAATPRRAAETEAALAGASLDQPESWERALAALGADYQPIDDMRASAGYRLASARALLQKALFEIASAPSEVTRIRGQREVQP